MSVINTNIMSLVAQQNLGKSQDALTTAMERLSSGLRINSASDDAAGQAIANRMSSQITGLGQAQRNANDGISIAQTTEGALNQVNDNLQRIRELSVQAGNETNSEADLQSIQDEIIQRQNEINRIAEETNFNGVNVLASDQSIKIQVGANDSELIDVNLQSINSQTLDIDTLDVRSMTFTDDLQERDAVIDPEWEEFSYTLDGASFELQVGDDNQLYALETTSSTYHEASFDTETGTVTIGSAIGTAGDLAGQGVAISTGTEFDTGEGVATLGAVSTTIEPELDIANVFQVNSSATTATGYYVEDVDGNFYAAQLDTATGEFTVEFTTATVVQADIATTAGGAPSTLGLAVSADQVLTTVQPAADLSTIAADLDVEEEDLTLYRDTRNDSWVIGSEDDAGNMTYYAARVNANDELRLGDEITVDPLATLDSALAQVDSLRSDLGALQNRFDDAITNLNTNQTNLSDARSRIEDADYAKEVAEMTRAQILQQAGTSVLAQANQIPQNVLSLLG